MSLDASGRQITRPRRRFSLREGNRAVRPTDRRSKMISAPTNFNHISHMGPGNGIQVRIKSLKSKNLDYFINDDYIIHYYRYKRAKEILKDNYWFWHLLIVALFTYACIRARICNTHVILYIFFLLL